MFDLNDDLTIYTSDLYNKVKKYITNLKISDGYYCIPLKETYVTDNFFMFSNYSDLYLNVSIYSDVFNSFLNEVKYKFYMDDSVKLMISDGKDVLIHELEKSPGYNNFNIIDNYSFNWLEYCNMSDNEKFFSHYFIYKYTTISYQNTYPHICLLFKSYNEKFSYINKNIDLHILLNKETVDDHLETIKPKNQMNKLLFDNQSPLRYYFNKLNLLDLYVNRDFIITSFVFYGENLINSNLTISKEKVLKMKNIKANDFGLRHVEGVKNIFTLISELDHEIFKYKRKLNDESINSLIKLFDDIDNIFKKGKTGIPKREISTREFCQILLFSSHLSFKLSGN